MSKNLLKVLGLASLVLLSSGSGYAERVKEWEKVSEDGLVTLTKYKDGGFKAEGYFESPTLKKEGAFPYAGRGVMKGFRNDYGNGMLLEFETRIMGNEFIVFDGLWSKADCIPDRLIINPGENQKNIDVRDWEKDLKDQFSKKVYLHLNTAGCDVMNYLRHYFGFEYTDCFGRLDERYQKNR